MEEQEENQPLYNVIVGDTDGSRLVFRSFDRSEVFAAQEEIIAFFEKFKPEFFSDETVVYDGMNFDSVTIIKCVETQETETTDEENQT